MNNFRKNYRDSVILLGLISLGFHLNEFIMFLLGTQFEVPYDICKLISYITCLGVIGLAFYYWDEKKD